VTLFGEFLHNRYRRTHKWYQYFAAYEAHFERFRNRHVTLFEIGIGEGGSLEQWRSYLGPFARIVGVDINPACAQLAEEEIHIRIGSQDDPAFLRALLDEFGAPDIVIDDGSHLQPHIKTTFDTLYPHVAKNGVYLVEDLHAAYWPNHGGGIRRPTSFIEIAKGYVDEMHAEYVWVEQPGDAQPRTVVGDRTRAIHFYDSVVVFEVGEYRTKRHRLSGDAAVFRPDWTAEDATPMPGGFQAPLPPPVPPMMPPGAAAAAPAARAVPVTPADVPARLRALEAELAALRASTSWRVTEPMRTLGRLFKR